MTRDKLEITIELEAGYVPYSTKRKNEKAIRAICRWLKETMRNEASFIPLYVEKDGESFIEDVAEGKVKSIKVKVK